VPSIVSRSMLDAFVRRAETLTASAPMQPGTTLPSRPIPDPQATSTASETAMTASTPNSSSRPGQPARPRHDRRTDGGAGRLLSLESFQAKQVLAREGDRQPPRRRRRFAGRRQAPRRCGRTLLATLGSSIRARTRLPRRRRRYHSLVASTNARALVLEREAREVDTTRESSMR
jgi:hypothetical protein